MKASKTTRHLLTAILFAVSLGLVFTSCKKISNEDGKEEDKNTELVTQPEATSTENNKSGGVYKGVLTGSTGYVKITLQGGQKSVTVTMDGVTKTLNEESFVPANWSSGQAITQAKFSKDNWRVVFAVNEDGSNPIIVVEIPGHSNIAVAAMKETSTSLVRSFEGAVNYGDTTANSIFNFVVNGNSFSGTVRIAGESETYSMSGTIQGDTTMVGTVNNATVSGTIRGNNASGNIVTPNTSAPWIAKRTL